MPAILLSTFPKFITSSCGKEPARLELPARLVPGLPTETHGGTGRIESWYVRKISYADALQMMCFLSMPRATAE